MKTYRSENQSRHRKNTEERGNKTLLGIFLETSDPGFEVADFDDLLFAAELHEAWPQRLLAVHRWDRIGHGAHVSHVSRRICKRECAYIAGDGLQANKVENQRWR